MPSPSSAASVGTGCGAETAGGSAAGSASLRPPPAPAPRPRRHLARAHDGPRWFWEVAWGPRGARRRVLRAIHSLWPQEWPLFPMRPSGRTGHHGQRQLRTAAGSPPSARLFPGGSRLQPTAAVGAPPPPRPQPRAGSGRSRQAARLGPGLPGPPGPPPPRAAGVVPAAAAGRQHCPRRAVLGRHPRGAEPARGSYRGTRRARAPGMLPAVPLVVLARGGGRGRERAGAYWAPRARLASLPTPTPRSPSGSGWTVVGVPFPSLTETEILTRRLWGTPRSPPRYPRAQPSVSGAGGRADPFRWGAPCSPRAQPSLPGAVRGSRGGTSERS